MQQAAITLALLATAASALALPALEAALSKPLVGLGLEDAAKPIGQLDEQRDPKLSLQLVGQTAPQLVPSIRAPATLVPSPAKAAGAQAEEALRDAELGVADERQARTVPVLHRRTGATQKQLLLAPTGAK